MIFRVAVYTQLQVETNPNIHIDIVRGRKEPKSQQAVQDTGVLNHSTYHLFLNLVNKDKSFPIIISPVVLKTP